MARAKAKSGRGGSQDAIALLKADHRQVEEWFEQFEKARDDAAQAEAGDQDLRRAQGPHHHRGGDLLPGLPRGDRGQGPAPRGRGRTRRRQEADRGDRGVVGPDDEYFDAKVKVLSEMIKHHVKEEEQPGGMFAEARKSDMDLDALGEQMAARKAELEGRKATIPTTMPPRGRQEGTQPGRAPHERHPLTASDDEHAARFATPCGQHGPRRSHRPRSHLGFRVSGWAARAARAGAPCRRHSTPARHRPRKRVPVIYANDNLGPWRSDAPALIAHCTDARRAGAALVQKLCPAARDEIVLKPRHSAFFGTALEALLDDHRIDTLVIVGVSAESCVWMTACDAHTRGFELVIPADTLAGASAAAVRRTLTSLAEVLGARVPSRARSIRFHHRRVR